jgi:class 3 adenylate cyclase
LRSAVWLGKLRRANLQRSSSLQMFSASSISGSGGPPEGNGSARRLAAIAFADIVGYSTLMAEDEARTHRRWMALLADVVRPGAQKHRGRVVKSTGDGILAEFPSALDAVEWAREVQEQVHRVGATESIELRPIALRIAVHIGDVMTTADDIYGDGVNVTARLQEYGEPGGVILSEAVYNLVRGIIGFLRLKNLRPVRAYALDGPRSSLTRPGWSRGSRPSIAVLPLQPARFDCHPALSDLRRCARRLPEPKAGCRPWRRAFTGLSGAHRPRRLGPSGLLRAHPPDADHLPETGLF